MSSSVTSQPWPPSAAVHGTSSSSEHTVDRLVVHFVAAKRSLSATSAVYRANEIVSQSRHHVEHRAILSAKNAYIKLDLGEQTHAMHSVREGLQNVGREAQLEFESVVKSLDIANDRLQATLTSLRKTLARPIVSERDNADVNAHDNPTRGGQSSPTGTTRDAAEVDHEDKTLYDFIDETTHTNLLDHLRQLIDSYNEAQGSLHTSQITLQQSLEVLDQSLQDITVNAKLNAEGERDAGDQQDNAAGFHLLVDHATEMASLLQSLISHYDLCITALKHTEGGGEAARLATATAPNPGNADGTGADDVDQMLATSPVEDSLYHNDNSIREPMTDEERHDMLSVLETDASQVDDVVSEINDRLVEMESELLVLSTSLVTPRATHCRLADIIARMSTHFNNDLLPASLSSAKTFQSTWETLREGLTTQTTDLSNLALFYENFIRGHSALLREVERRSLVARKIRSIADKARRDMQALYAEDEDMRSQFLKDVGEYLPRDIWPDIMLGPEEWVIKAVSRQVERKDGSWDGHADREEGLVYKRDEDGADRDAGDGPSVIDHEEDSEDDLQETQGGNATRSP